MRYEELILKLAKSRDKGIGRKDVVKLLNISKDQAYRILKKMVMNNKLIIIGSGKATKYLAK